MKNISTKIINSVFNDYKKYKNYNEFLLAKGAIKKKGNDIVILMYELSEIAKYEESFIDSFITDIEDKFIFSEISKINDYFIPKTFFDRVKKLFPEDKNMTLSEFLTKHPDKVPAWESVMMKKWDGVKFV